ncbi:hypothetical protein MHU86_16398 [Fragilaria crotonensis]|nr:hypothetical protein MHU86_16398 [Fragilaria crotonensis]
MMVNVLGPVVEVNLRVGIPKGLLADRSSDMLMGCAGVRRVMLVDPDANAIMAMTPFRAMASELQNGFISPNIGGNVQEVDTAKWDAIKAMITGARGVGSAEITRLRWTVRAANVGMATAVISQPLGENQPCWIPLLKDLTTDAEDTVWLPGKLRSFDPPSEDQTVLMVMETETELIKSELAWTRDGERIIQSRGGLGAKVKDDGTVHLTKGGKFYSSMYAAAEPATLLYLGLKVRHEALFEAWQKDTTGITTSTRNGQILYDIDCQGQIQRDWATEFFRNPSMVKVGVQRVAVVDNTAGEVMVCTPMRAAAYLIRKERKTPDVAVSNSSRVEDVTQKELDMALKFLRNKNGGTITTDADEHAGIPTRLHITERDADVDEVVSDWDLVGYSKGGGWAKFFAEVMTEKNWCMAVIQGRTSDRKNSNSGLRYNLVFKDTEAELVFGEHRNFKRGAQDDVIVGLQLRRGYAVIRGIVLENGEQSQFDQMIMPRGLRGVFNNDTRVANPLIEWVIRPGASLDQLHLVEIRKRMSFRAYVISVILSVLFLLCFLRFIPIFKLISMAGCTAMLGIVG